MLSAPYAYAEDASVFWENRTQSTLYLQIYHDNTCILPQPIALGYNSAYPDTNSDGATIIWGHLSGTKSEVGCDNNNPDPSSAASNVLITSYTAQDKATIPQEGNGITSSTSIVNYGYGDIYKYSITSYTPTPPGPPAQITTVDFKWSGIEANSPQGLSSTVDLLTSMLSNRYQNYELIDTKITKDKNNAYDIDIKYHDKDKD